MCTREQDIDRYKTLRPDRSLTVAVLKRPRGGHLIARVRQFGPAP
jgi:hypothetical protein